MKDQGIFIDLMISNAKIYLSHLSTSLLFIESCLNFLPYETCNFKMDLTYYGQDTKDNLTIDDILNELGLALEYQASYGRQINIPAYIGFTETLYSKNKEIQLFYGGQLHLTDTGGWILYSWGQALPLVDIQLLEETKGKEILYLYKNIQMAVAEQVSRV